MSDRKIDEGYSDDETFEEVYEHWYVQYVLFEGEDDSWKYCIIKDKPWLDQVFEEMDEEERWKKESQLMITDSNATATIHTASISDVLCYARIFDAVHQQGKLAIMP